LAHADHHGRAGIEAGETSHWGGTYRPYTPAIELLFVCTGNICRSPMAAGLARRRLAEAGLSVAVSSAGLTAPGQPPSPGAVMAMAERGVELSGHLSCHLTAEAVARADLVVGLAKEHVREAVALVPGAFGRAFTLKELVHLAGNAAAGPRREDEGLDAWLTRIAAGRRPSALLGVELDPDYDVADPLGGTPAAYEQTATEIARLVDELVGAVWPAALVHRLRRVVSSLDKPAADDVLFSIIERELERQNTTLQLIPSENFASRAVLAATGSVLTNKYSEGYPGRRYYGGNRVIDEVEELARQRCRDLFGADHANVQPHSGASANFATYMALLDPGDTALALNLDQGGHLTHGSPASVTGKLWNFVHYRLTASDERIDLDQVRDLALEHHPKVILTGATAYPRIIEPEPFRAIADEVGALFVFDAAHIAGLVAGGAHPSPVPYADVVTFTTHKTLRGPRGGAIVCKQEHAAAIDRAVFPGLQGGPLDHVIAAKAVCFAEAATPEFSAYAHQIVANARALAAGLAKRGLRLVSGGTDNHLILVDLRSFAAELTGKMAQEALDRAGITTNKNTVPDDPRSPFVTSGLRIGTPAITTAGMREPEMEDIADLLVRGLRAAIAGPLASDGKPTPDEPELAAIAEDVARLCSKFTPYPPV